MRVAQVLSLLAVTLSVSAKDRSAALSELEQSYLDSTFEKMKGLYSNRVVELVLRGGEIRIASGQMVVFHCPNVNESDHVRWVRNGKEIGPLLKDNSRQFQHHNQLILMPAVKDIDNGYYECYVGSQLQEFAHVRVQEYFIALLNGLWVFVVIVCVGATFLLALRFAMYLLMSATPRANSAMEEYDLAELRLEEDSSEP